MRELREEQFKKMAKAVVASYLTESTPLEQGVIKTSLEQELNPDQIKNLVQLANMMAHLKLYDNKQDGDKVIEFEPADPSSVLKQIYREGPTSEEVPMEDAAPDRASDMFGGMGELLNKVKGMLGNQDGPLSSGTTEEVVESPCGEEGIEVSPQKKQMLIIKIRKVAADFSDKRLQCAHEYKEELDKLASTFAKLYGPDLDEFEKDAMSVRGHSSLPVLTDIRRCLRMPGLTEGDLVKSARVVDTDTLVMRGLDKLIKLSQAFDETVAGQQYVKKEFGKWL
jgi:hypothetical protein